MIQEDEPESPQEVTPEQLEEDPGWLADPDPARERSLRQQWLGSFVGLRNEVAQWLQEHQNARSAQMGPLKEEAALGPWARLFGDLLDLAAEGPFQLLTAAELSMWYSDISAQVELCFTRPQGPLENRVQNARTNVLAYIQRFGSRQNLFSEPFLNQPEWLSLLIRAQSYAASDEAAQRTASSVERAIRAATDVKGELDGKLNQVSDLAEVVEQAASRAEHAQIEARKAAGERGLDEFGDRFKLYGNEQLKSAARFRTATIAVLVGALLVALVFVFQLDVMTLPEDVRPDPDSWHTIVYRIAIIAGLTGLSAYLGRQAAQLRRLGDWAKTLEVQSRSFGAFVEPIPDAATKNSVYAAMSSRLLAAPPDKASSEQEVSSSAVDRIVDAIIRRA